MRGVVEVIVCVAEPVVGVAVPLPERFVVRVWWCGGWREELGRGRREVGAVGAGDGIVERKQQRML